MFIFKTRFSMRNISIELFVCVGKYIKVLFIKQIVLNDFAIFSQSFKHLKFVSTYIKPCFFQSSFFINNFWIIKCDLKSHWRSHKAIFMFKNHLFLRYIFCSTPNLLKTFQECQHYEVKKSIKVIQGHKRLLLCKNHLNTFVHRPIFDKICMNANIIKTHFFHKRPEISFHVMENFYTFLP